MFEFSRLEREVGRVEVGGYSCVLNAHKLDIAGFVKEQCE